MTDSLRDRDELEVVDHGQRLLVLLGTARTSRTWLAAADGGELTVARRLGSCARDEGAAIRARLEAARGIAHPSLIPPAALWTAGSALWVTRRYGDGVSLRRLIAVARLAPAHLLTVADDVLSALVALHAAGIVHGDLHPGNILIGPDGVAAAVDVGLAPAALGDFGRDGGDAGSAGAVDQPFEDLAALAAALHSALLPPGRRAARAGITAEVPAALGRLLDGEGGPLAGAATAAEALVAVRATAGEPRPGARREIGALVVPLRHERIGVARAYERHGGVLSLPGDGAVVPPPPPPALRPALPPVGATAPAPPGVGQAAEIPDPTPLGLPSGSHPGSGPMPLPERAASAVAQAKTQLHRAAAQAGARLDRAVAALRRGVRAAGMAFGSGATSLASVAQGLAAATLRGRLPHLPRRLRMILWSLPVTAAILTAGIGLALVPHPSPGTSPATSAAPPPSSGGLATTAPPVSAAASPTPSVPGGSAPPAPPTAGDVAGLSVTLADSASCTAGPGRSCLLRVTVELAPHPFETVAWELMLVDTCTGSAAMRPGTSVPAAAAYAYVWGESLVTFATADPVTLYAVTTSPARASSRALEVAGGGSGC